MKFIGATVLVSALVSMATAQIVSITSPLSGTKYKAGQNAIISWVNPKVSTISQIVLAKGPSTALQPVLTIVTNVNANDLTYTWAIPKELEGGNDYAFEIGTSPDLAFAGPFTIEGASGSSSGSTNGSASGSGSTPPVIAAAPPGGNNSPSTTSSTTSQTSPHNGNASHSSAANKQMAGQAMIAFGLVATVVSQLF